MITELTPHEKTDNSLICKNFNIRICTICGNDKIESYEFGLSCEECGSFLERL